MIDFVLTVSVTKIQVFESRLGLNTKQIVDAS
jgi:hypothetical protein